VLGFGSVARQGKNTHRYVCNSRLDCFLIALIFNGNMVLPSKLASFEAFLARFNEMAVNPGARVRTPVVPFIPTTILPTLSDNWLLGFADAEGCFTCSFLTGVTAYRFRFMIAQKWAINAPILEHLTTLLGGTVLPHTVADVFELTVNGLRNQTAVMAYFDSHKLLTHKHASYLLWKEVGAAIERGEHLEPTSRALLRAKASTINPTG